MKKNKINAFNEKNTFVFTREQLKKIYGGSNGKRLGGHAVKS